MSILLSHRIQLPIHLVQLFLCHADLILSIVVIASGIFLRGHIITLSASTKAIAEITWQLLTRHHSKFQKRHSATANLIMNVLEPPFWLAAFALMIWSQNTICIAPQCAVGWVMVALNLCLVWLSTWTAIISVIDFRFFKANGYERGDRRRRRNNNNAAAFARNKGGAYPVGHFEGEPMGNPQDMSHRGY